MANLAFRRGQCGFLQMSEIIAETMTKAEYIAAPTYDDYVQTDTTARQIATEIICKLANV